MLLASAYAEADTHVKGYFRKNGTYVAPHYRSSPNSTKLDNWSTKGNINPYTGKVGTKDPYPEANIARPFKNDSYTANQNSTRGIDTYSVGTQLFGVVNTNSQGKPKIISTKKIPRIPGTRIGIMARTAVTELSTLTTKITAPSKTSWSSGAFVEDEGRTATFTRNVTPQNGWVVSGVVLNEDDPEGDWQIQLGINGSTLTPILFQVVDKNNNLESPEDKVLSEVQAAEDRVNLRRCLDGSLTSLCNRSRLTPEQQQQADLSEAKVNLRRCLDGSLTSICDKSKLTSAEREQASIAEQRVNVRRCYDGSLSSLCNKELLKSTVRQYPNLIPNR